MMLRALWYMEIILQMTFKKKFLTLPSITWGT